MRKPALYSPARRPTAAAGAAAADAAPAGDPAMPPSPAASADLAAAPARPPRHAAWRSPRALVAGWVVLGAVAAALWWVRPPASPALTQKDIDAAVLRTLTSQTLPSPTARAAEQVRRAVVRVVAYGPDERGRMDEIGVGTGVVIVDKGVILTNLHVVAGAQRVKLTFADGSDSAATLIGAQPDDDLAVLQAHTIPDDLVAATLRSTHDLRPGDGVVAVGFPFGIGPSVSAGVVSGLGRSFKSPDGGQEMRNLIQFDAAANPGNSGGPLVTLDGEVVGIVTGILNPTRHRTFAGIGFAVPIENAAAAAGLPPF